MNTSNLSLATLTFDLLASDMDGAGSGEVVPLHILPVGKFSAPDGRPASVAGSEVSEWVLDESIAARVIADVVKRKGAQDIVIDYEHQTLLSEKNGKPAPAAGWVSPASLAFDKNVGLIGIPKWTEAGGRMVAEKEYRYLSPVFLFDKKTGEVTHLLHMALTNDPALNNLNEVGMAALSAQFNLNPDGGESSKPKEHTKMKQLLAVLKLNADASESAAIDAVTTLQTDASQVVALKAENDTLKANQFDPVKHIPMTEHKATADALAALTAQVETTEHDALLQAALKDGRILPPNQAYWTAQPLAALKAFLTDAKPLVAALSANQTGGKAPAADADNAVQLSDEELAVCKSLGVSAEDFAKQKAQ